MSVKALSHTTIGFFGCMMFATLSACGEPVQIEYEPYDPALHGQVVQFSEPMAYIVLEPHDSRVWGKEVVEIGRSLNTLKSANEWRENDAVRLPSDPYVIESLEPVTRLTIRASYWRRWNELSNPLSPDDYHGIVLEDERGILSTMRISGLAKSDRGDLVPPLPWDKGENR